LRNLTYSSYFFSNPAIPFLLWLVAWAMALPNGKQTMSFCPIGSPTTALWLVAWAIGSPTTALWLVGILSEK